MSIETRLERAKAALLEIGRPDLARSIEHHTGRHDSEHIGWASTLPIADKLLIRRAAALAAFGLDIVHERSVACEACVIEDTSCALVSRLDYIRRRPCPNHRPTATNEQGETS